MGKGGPETFRSFGELAASQGGESSEGTPSDQEKLAAIHELHDEVFESPELANIPRASYYLGRTPETFGKELFGGLEAIKYGQVMFKGEQAPGSEKMLQVEVGWTDKDGKNFKPSAKGHIAEKGTGLFAGETQQDDDRVREVASPEDLSLFILKRVDHLVAAQDKRIEIDGLQIFPVPDPGYEPGPGGQERRLPIDKDRRQYLEYLLQHPKTVGWSASGDWQNDSHVIAFEKGFMVETPGADDPKVNQSFATYLWRFSGEEVDQIKQAKSPQEKKKLVSALVGAVMRQPDAQQRRSFRLKMKAERLYHTDTWHDRIEETITEELSN